MKKGGTVEVVVLQRSPFLYFVVVLLFGVGGFLLSHNLPVAVPSARAGLASGFGMGPGVSLLLLATDKHPRHSGRGCCVRYCVVDANTGSV